jgi:hypothetical protein
MDAGVRILPPACAGHRIRRGLRAGTGECAFAVRERPRHEFGHALVARAGSDLAAHGRHAARHAAGGRHRPRFAYVLLALGLLVLFTPGYAFDGLWFAFIGFFIIAAARQQATGAEIRANLSGGFAARAPGVRPSRPGGRHRRVPTPGRSRLHHRREARDPRRTTGTDTAIRGSGPDDRRPGCVAWQSGSRTLAPRSSRATGAGSSAGTIHRTRAPHRTT